MYVLGLILGIEKSIYYSTKQKKYLNTLGLLWRIEKNALKITWRNLLEYPGSSEQNQDPGSLKTEVRGDFNIHGTKYFQDAVFHQKIGDPF